MNHCSTLAAGLRCKSSLYQIINAAANCSSPHEFRRHFDSFIVACFSDSDVSLIFCFLPVWDVLQLCCNRHESGELACNLLHIIGSSEITMVCSLLLSSFLNLHSSTIVEEEQPLLPYLLECAQETRLRINGIKFNNFFWLDVINWTGSEITSLQVFLKYGGWFDLSKEKRLQTMKNMLFQLIEACKKSGQWDPVTLQRDLTIIPYHGTMEKVNELSECFKIIVEEEVNPFAVCRKRELDQVRVPRGIPSGETLTEFYDTLYPDEKYGMNVPASLMHICRISIRRALHENYQLPRGVRKLGFPTVLQKYIRNDTD